MTTEKCEQACVWTEVHTGMHTLRTLTRGGLCQVFNPHNHLRERGNFPPHFIDRQTEADRKIKHQVSDAPRIKTKAMWLQSTEVGSFLSPSLLALETKQIWEC